MSAILLHFWPYIAAALAAGFAFLKVYRAGQSSERSKQAQAEKKAIDTARKVDGEVDRMSGDEARKELSKWSR